MAKSPIPTDQVDAPAKRGPQANRKPPPGGAPAMRVVEIAPAAQRARMRLRHWVTLAAFVVFCLAPTAATGIYLFARAADQYASTVGFTVRKEEVTNPVETLVGLAGMSNSSGSDTDILYEYIQSQGLVMDIDERIDVSAMFSKPDNDPVFTLGPDPTVEELVDFWHGMVKVSYDPGTGLIEVEARAFTPEDAQLITETLFDMSSQRINELSAVAQSDLTEYARRDLEDAVERLRAARTALTRFRNVEQIVDPQADIQGQMGVLNTLQAQLAESLIEYDLTLQQTTGANLRGDQIERRIGVIRNRIAEERRKLGVGGSGESGGYADVIGEFESLSLDREFAEQAYVSAQAAYDGAKAEARRQSRYLAAYVDPTLPQSPRYPQRWLLLAVVALGSFGLFCLITLVAYSMKDRR